MTQTFGGLNPARQFAEEESRKKKIELWVFLVKQDGLQYIVADEKGKEGLVGKMMNHYQDGQLA